MHLASHDLGQLPYCRCGGPLQQLQEVGVVFVLDEADGLHVANSDAELNGAFEGVDVEDGIYRFFDESGSPLVAEFVVPNKRGRGVFGLWRWVRSGTYRLVPSNDVASLHLSDVLDAIVAVEPNGFFPDIEAVRIAIGGRA